MKNVSRGIVIPEFSSCRRFIIVPNIEMRIRTAADTHAEITVVELGSANFE